MASDGDELVHAVVELGQELLLSGGEDLVADAAVTSTVFRHPGHGFVVVLAVIALTSAPLGTASPAKNGKMTNGEVEATKQNKRFEDTANEKCYL